MGFNCDEEDCVLLTRVVLEEEVKYILFSMPENKSLGPDGFTVEFFKEAWEVVGKDVMGAV